MEKYLLGMFSLIFKTFGTSENICLKKWKNLLNSESQSSRFHRVGFLSTLPNTGGWEVKGGKVLYVWIVFGQNTIIFQSLSLHCVMVACQIISLEELVFLLKLDYSEFLSIWIHMLETKFDLRTLSIHFFCLGSGIQDQHYTPAFSLLPAGLPRNTEKLGEILHGYFILSKLLGKLVFFLKNVSFLHN